MGKGADRDFYFMVEYERLPLTYNETGPKMDWLSFPKGTFTTIDDATSFLRCFVPSATGRKISIKKITTP